MRERPKRCPVLPTESRSRWHNTSYKRGQGSQTGAYKTQPKRLGGDRGLLRLPQCSECSALTAHPLHEGHALLMSCLALPPVNPRSGLSLSPTIKEMETRRWYVSDVSLHQSEERQSPNLPPSIHLSVSHLHLCLRWSSFFPAEKCSGATREDRGPGRASLMQRCRNDRPDAAGGEGRKMTLSLRRLHGGY